MQMALTWVTSRVTILRSVNKIHIKQLLLCLRWNVKPGRQLKWTLIFFLPRAITYLAFSSTIHKTMIACPGILHTILSNTDIYWGILEGKFELLLNLTFPTFKSYRKRNLHVQQECYPFHREPIIQTTPFLFSITADVSKNKLPLCSYTYML